MLLRWTKDSGFLRFRVSLSVDLGLRCAVMMAVTGSSAYGTWQDDIGFSRLRQQLDSARPTGAGVRVALVEASLNGPGDPYLPSDAVSIAILLQRAYRLHLEWYSRAKLEAMK